MPFVNIKIAGGATSEEKARLIEGATKLLTEVLGKPAKSTYVVIDEVNPDNWGVGGESLTELRKKS